MIKYEHFIIVPTDETQEEWTIACPKGKMTDKTFKSVDEAKEYIDTKPWDLILTTAGLITEALKERDNK